MRRLKRIAAAVLVLCFSGALFEQIGRYRDRKRYPQIGRSVDIGGRTLNIYCSGEGSPAVVFEAGGHSSGYTWINVQPEIAKLTRACWYDRAGLGWSDPGPSPRTFIAIAKELHALLRAAAVPRLTCSSREADSGMTSCASLMAFIRPKWPEQF